MTDQKSPEIPVTEMLKSVPGALGIRLEEEPTFEVVLEKGDISFRRYDPMLLAVVRMNVPREKALDEAFNTLASFIYGANASSTKYEMTTPVFQISEGKGELSDDQSPSWGIGFVMSKDLAVEDLPKPDDSSIRFENWPVKTFAVYRYSGNNTDEKVREAAEHLQSGLKSVPCRIISPLIVAQYDQPLAVPLFKRNEVFIEVDLSGEPEHAFA